MPAFAWLEIPDFAFEFAAVWLSGTFCSQFFLQYCLSLKKAQPVYLRFGFRYFFFTILAAVDFFFLIGQEEDLVKLLLDGSDTARIPAGDDVFDLLWKMQFLFRHRSCRP